MPIRDRDTGSVIDHHLATDTLSRLRNVETDRAAFRTNLVRLGRICGTELVDGKLRTDSVQVDTPLTETTVEQVSGLDDVVAVTILRAAIPFVEGLLEVFPGARQGVISAGRDEIAGMNEDGTFPIDVEYVKLPAIEPGDTVIVADPMLATGSTATAVLSRVMEVAPPAADIILLAAVSAPEGIERVAESFPEVEVISVAVDDHLDDRGYIVPGLGDAGDRAFGASGE